MDPDWRMLRVIRPEAGEERSSSKTASKGSSNISFACYHARWQVKRTTGLFDEGLGPGLENAEGHQTRSRRRTKFFEDRERRVFEYIVRMLSCPLAGEANHRII
jgi:hypothetical protein